MTALDRLLPRSRTLAVAGLLLLIALGTLAAALLTPPLSFIANVLILLVFLTASWYFGIVGALLSWGATFVVRYLADTYAGFPIHLDDDFRGFLTAVTLGIIFQLRRSLASRRVALEESEERFRRLSQASFEGILISQGGKMTEVNDALVRMMRLPREELIGSSGISFLSPEDARRAELFGRALDESQDPAPIELTIHRKDETTFDAELIARSMVSKGASFHIIGIRDITDRKKTEEALRRNERLSALGTLVAGVAHEINNPLSYIRGNVELMQLDAKEMAGADAPSRKAAEGMIEHSQAALEGLDRIASITRSLKQIARAPNRVRAREDVSRLVTNVVQIAGARMPTNVRVKLDLQAKRPVEANGSELAQIFLNLLFNATDAVGSNGGEILVRTYEEGDRVVVEVHDDGPGIPLEKQEKLFTPFFTTKPQGTGLGLSVSRSIAKDHGGDLVFESTPGKGTMFRLTLPASPEVARP